MTVLSGVYHGTCVLRSHKQCQRGSVCKTVTTREDRRREVAKQEEDNEKSIKIEAKVNLCVCVCEREGGGRYCITLTRRTKNKDSVMEICLFL